MATNSEYPAVTLNMSYYAVTVNISPFEEAKEVGFYLTKGTAERVAKFIREVFEQKVSGGIDIGIRAYEDEMINTVMGLRLKQTPKGAITTICQTFSQNETARILSFLPILLEKQMIPTSGIDEPKYLCNGLFHCVILDFQPFDRSHRLFVGYYQSSQTAQIASNYIKETHYNEKIGFGFDMTIESYVGNFIEYQSGKQYIKIGDKHEPILSSCDCDEYIRISKSVNEAIDKWSRN